MAAHKIATRHEWLAARAALLEREKEHTRIGDELSRQRRELAWLPAEKQYTLQTADGPSRPGAERPQRGRGRLAALDPPARRIRRRLR